MKVLKRYRLFIVVLAVNLLMIYLNEKQGLLALNITGSNIIEMLGIIPPIFIILGLMDVWVEKEVMIKLLGERSGVGGYVVAFLLGSMAAGPLYAAFPIATILLKKGSKLTNVFIFIGAWSTTKIPMLLFEASALGVDFMLLRLLLNIIGIFVIAQLMDRLLNEDDKSMIYMNSTQE